jgi:chaperone modulatory protein CbpM
MSTTYSHDATPSPRALHGLIVEQEVHYSWVELRRACGAEQPPNDMPLQALVDEGVLQPLGPGPSEWQFDGHELQRALQALRLMNDLDLSASGAALVLDLLARIQALEVRLGRMGWQ